MARNVSLREPSPGVRKEVVPFPLESVIILAIAQCRVVPRDDVLGEVCVETISPFAKGARVVYGGSKSVKVDG